MGGYGSIIHGSKVADATIAFGPQTRLDNAILRPPAEDMESLLALGANVRAAVLAAHARGALVEVHCAADEHMWHGLNLPLSDGALTVHPLMPRKPFAKLLDKAKILLPILADVIGRVIARPPTPRHPCNAEGKSVANVSPQVLVAQWANGRVNRYTSSREELLNLFFGEKAPDMMPRPGDWFCPACSRRNMTARFFCRFCGIQDAASVLEDVAKVPGARDYPCVGDWGCGSCGTANVAYDHSCSNSKCGLAKGDNPKSVVVS